MTAAVFVVMAAIATISKRDFSFLGKFLFVGLILLIIASLANIFFQVPVASIAISAIAVMIFSLYLLYDVSSIVRGARPTTSWRRWRCSSTSSTSSSTCSTCCSFSPGSATSKRRL